MAVKVTRLLGRGDFAGFSKEYLGALRAHWAGDHAAAIVQAADLLAENPEHPERFHLYRLWIDALAECGEPEALAELAEHLLLRGQADPEDLGTYQALRGVAHFELDEQRAARLLTRAARHRVEDPFALELAQLVHGRGEASLDLLNATTGINDYFHLRTLARGLHAKGEFAAVKEVLQHVTARFEGSPLESEFALHGAFDKGDFVAAAREAEALVNRFPRHPDYSALHGFALYRTGRLNDAKDVLSKALHLAGSQDPDILAVLGHCLADLGQNEQAQQTLKRAVSARKAAGLPASAEQARLEALEEAARGEALDPAMTMPRQTRTWLVPLSERRYLELCTSPEREIERLSRPMGTAPKPGDLCFFASADGDSRIRIAAIYTVDSDPIWHPYHGHETMLQLVERPPVAIPVDVALLDEDEAEADLALDRNHPFTHGIYELEAGALDVITEAVRRRREEDEDATSREVGSA